MQLDKFTFGKTPAAIYLADHLNTLNDKLLTRKVSVLICNLQRVINELEASNVAGYLSVHVITSLNQALKDRALQGYYQLECINLLAAQLAHNVMVGSIKELVRKATVVRQCELAQAKIVPTKLGQTYNMNNILIATVLDCPEADGELFVIKEPMNLSVVTDNITPETLTAKSKAKLQRRNKRNTFY